MHPLKNDSSVAGRYDESPSGRLSRASSEGGALALWCLLAYMWLDLIRPSFVWHFPKVLSTILFAFWVAQTQKRIPSQNIYMLFLLCVMGFDILIAVNTFAAVWTTYGMVVLILGLCLPMVQFVNSVERVRLVMNTLIAIYVAIGAWAIFHRGYGPAAADGGQDENYVTACMAMALPLAIYSSYAATSHMKKVLYLALVPVLLLAVLVAENPSRGGFIGILAVIAYILFYSRKRMASIVSAGVIVLTVALMAGASYWDEIKTITDTESGTADHRKELWNIATNMFMAYPITGVGPDNFRWRIGEFETPETFEKYKRSLAGSAVTHSLYFELLAELGSVGGILFVLIILRNFRDMREVKKLAGFQLRPSLLGAESVHDNEVRTLHYYAHALMASFIAFLVCSAFISTLYYTYFWLYASLIASLRHVADGILSNNGKSPVEAKPNPGNYHTSLVTR